jgi:hypothetical protein
MVRTKGSPDPLKRVRAFDLSLFKVPYAVIANELDVSERTVKRWIQFERNQRQNVTNDSIRLEIFGQVDQVLAEAWKNYQLQELGSSGCGRALRVVLAVVKFRASLHGLGIDSEVRKEIDELKGEAELVQRLALDKVAIQREQGAASSNQDTNSGSGIVD